MKKKGFYIIKEQAERISDTRYVPDYRWVHRTGIYHSRKTFDVDK